YRKSAYPDNLLALEHHRPARALFGGNMLLREQPLQLLFRAAVQRPEAVTGTPVANPQLRAEQIGAQQAIRFAAFLTGPFLDDHRSQPHTDLDNVYFSWNWQGVFIPSGRRLRSGCAKLQTITSAHSHPTSRHLCLW